MTEAIQALMERADAELDPYEYRLFNHYVRHWLRGENVLGDGCRELAAACKMSARKALAARRGLVAKGFLEGDMNARKSAALFITASHLPQMPAAHLTQDTASHMTQDDETASYSTQFAASHLTQTPETASDMTQPLAGARDEESFNAFSSTGERFNSKGEKTRAREETPPSATQASHPLVMAYLSAFPDNAKPAPRADWQATATALTAKGVKPEHVTGLVREKLRQGKLAYRFAWVVDDIAEWQARHVHVTPQFAYYVPPERPTHAPISPERQLQLVQWGKRVLAGSTEACPA